MKTKKTSELKINKSHRHYLLLALTLLIFSTLVLWFLQNNLKFDLEMQNYLVQSAKMQEKSTQDMSTLLNYPRYISDKINGHYLDLELALSPTEHYQGLSDRESLCPNCGMLFLFPEAKEQSFVMRNMNFPLDIIFISPENLIVKIYENLRPEGSEPKNFYKSFAPADKVLELNAGMSQILNFKEGDSLNFSL